MKKKILLSLTCLLLVSGCSSVQLTNGENALVTFKNNEGISTDDLYQELKSIYGAEKVMDLIDSFLLNKKYESTKEEKDYVKEKFATVKASAEEMNADLELYLYYYYGIKNVDSFKDYLALNYKRDQWAKDYAKTTVTEKQINEYYENEVFGDIEASQILITVDAKEDAEEEARHAADEKARQTAMDIIEKLNNGEDFATLAKEYSEDDTTKNDGGSLGKVNTGNVSDEVINALRNLEDGSYSTTPVMSEYGYHILYRKSQDKKKELDDELTDEIKTIIGEEIADTTENFSVKALKELRSEYDMKFEDAELEKDYEALVTRLENQNTQAAQQ